WRLVRAGRRRDPRDGVRPLPGRPQLHPVAAARLRVPRGRAQGDQRLRGRGRPDTRERAAAFTDPPSLRHGIPALGDGGQRLRVRAPRAARLVLADREPDRASSGDRRHRVRADPVRRESLVEPGSDDAARPGAVAAAPDDARAVARPARSVDSRAAGSARPRRQAGAGRPTRGGDGVRERSASVVWNGDLLHGQGTIAAAPSGAFGPLDVTWASRAEEPNGRTSPEELIASAWAACFAMALSNGLAG